MGSKCCKEEELDESNSRNVCQNIKCHISDSMRPIRETREEKREREKHFERMIADENACYRGEDQSNSNSPFR